MAECLPQTPVSRTPEQTARLAWVILGLAMACCLVLCGLVVYGLWQLRASIVGPQSQNTLEAFTSPVFRIRAGEEQSIGVPLGQAIFLNAGETVYIGESAPPGEAALLTLWDGSTLQLYAGTRVTLQRLEATLYSDQFQDVVLELVSGQVLLGVAQTGQYRQVNFAVLIPGGRVELDPGGTYLVRSDPVPEIAVRRGQAKVGSTTTPGTVVVDAGQKAVIRSGSPLTAEPAEWQLLQNGDFAQAVGGELLGWVFRSDQYGDGGDENAVYNLLQDMVGGQVVPVVELLRKGGTEDLCAAILSQEIEADLSPYEQVQLDLDLNLKYQGLPGGGLGGEDYPFAVRIRYQDAEGRNRQYLYGFYYYTSGRYRTTPVSGEAQLLPNYRWTHVSLQLLDIRPQLALLNGIDLLASGQDYRSWVANVSLSAILNQD
jgi:hypothetical protein